MVEKVCLLQRKVLWAVSSWSYIILWCFASFGMAALWKRVITKGLWGLVKTVHINFRKCKWLIKAFWCLSPKTKIIQGRIDSNKTTAFVCDIPERRCKIYFIMKLPKVLDKWFICRSHSGLARKLLSRVARIWCKYEMETR